MNLCLITSSFPTQESDIAAPFVPPMARELRALGHAVWIVTPTKDGAPIGWSEDGLVYWFPWRAGGERLVNLNPRSPRDAFRMWSLMRGGKRALMDIVPGKRIDACIGLWAAPGGYLAWEAKKRFGTPFGVWALGSDINTWAQYPVIGRMIRATLRNADALFADGFDLVRKTEALAGRRCLYISSMRPLLFERANRVPLGPQPIHFLFVGRWEKVKGVDILLEAVKLVVQNQGEEAFEVMLVGGGVMEAQLREFIAENNLSRVVRVVKQPPFPDLLGYFKAASCVVIPSRSESIPLVLGEALQADAPLIVSDVGDMGKLAREYDLGRVVPPENAEALADALCDFVRNGQAAGARRGELVRQLDLRTSARVMSERMQSTLN